ncbi:unnamed protein product [Coccothraustes coccothraustes]
MPVLCAFVLHVSAAAALCGSRRQRNGFFVSDWKGTVPDEFEGCAENASVVRLRSSRLSSGRVLRPSEAKKRLLRALSIVPVSDWKGTVPDEFESCAENARVVRLRSSRLSSGRALRLPEAKELLLYALSILPVSDWKGTVPDEFESCAENARVVRLRSSRLSSGRALRLPEAKELLLYALSIVPLAVLAKARLLPKAARDRRLAPDSSRLASSVSDWKGTVPDEFEGCAENASVVRLRSSRLSSGRVLRPSEAKKRLLRALSIVPVSDWKGTVPDEFESCAENARVVRLRSSRLSSGRALRLPEAKELLLYALSIVPLAVLAKARLLPKAARDRRLAPDSSRLASSVSDWKGTVPDEFEGCAENASVVRLRSSRLSSGRVLRPSEAKKRLLRALSIVPLAVLSKGQLLPKAARDRRLAPHSSRLASSVCLSACIFAESFSTLSHKEKLCLHCKYCPTVSDWKGTVPDEFESCAENARVVRLRSSRLSSGRALRLPEAKELLLYALSIVPLAVLAKARLLPKAARDRRLAPDSSRLASSVSDWKGTVPDEFEGCAENASVVRLRSSRLSSGRVLRPSEAKKRLLRALSIVPVSDWKGTVPDEFESCAENARVVRLRSSRLSSGRALRLPEAKELLLYALSIVPLAVLAKARLLPKAARDRRLAPHSSRLASSVCLSACIFAESFSTLSHKEKLCLHCKYCPTVSDWKGTVPDEFESCAENARVVRLRSSRLSSGRALRLPEAKELLLYALSIVPLAVLAKARLLPKAARDRRLAPDSSRLASSVCLSACIFAESFSTLSHKEKLCLH